MASHTYILSSSANLFLNQVHIQVIKRTALQYQHPVEKILHRTVQSKKITSWTFRMFMEFINFIAARLPTQISCDKYMTLLKFIPIPSSQFFTDENMEPSGMVHGRYSGEHHSSCVRHQMLHLTVPNLTRSQIDSLPSPPFRSFHVWGSIHCHILVEESYLEYSSRRQVHCAIFGLP